LTVRGQKNLFLSKNRAWPSLCWLGQAYARLGRQK